MAAKISKILVINVARIGDTLLTTPVLRALKNTFPNARLDCLAHPKRAAVLQGLEWLDSLASITPKRATWRGWFSGKHWDYALVYGHDAALIRYAARVAARVIAFEQADADINRLLWRAVTFSVPREQMHAVEEHALLASALCVETRDQRLAYRASETELKNARMWLAKNIPVHVAPLVGMQIASFPTKAYRDWPLENFVALGRRILQEFPKAHMLILGGKESVAKARHLASELAGHATSVAGDFDLRGSAALMRCSIIVIIPAHDWRRRIIPCSESWTIRASA
ncbi:MAG: glycosyltransferase family 9 protein [Gammaproteobacteria bacterium]|nr:glycosyltransferase family 9 protein [Gammaproteobacteria bacterium]